MARPRRYDHATLVDHAVALAAAGGPSAVTMTAVAKAAGAPSGSVYHRFPGRSSLLAAVWTRTVDDFQAGFLVALAADDPRAGCVAAAQHVLRWGAANPRAAAVLLHGEAAFSPAEWDADDRARADESRARLRTAIASTVERLGLPPERADRVPLAAVDLPYAVVRRHLRAGTAMPDDAAEAIAACVETLL